MMNHQGFGLSLDVPNGWQGRVYRRSEAFAISLEAATVPLTPIGEPLTSTLGEMKEDDLYVLCEDQRLPVELLGNPDSGWTARSLPIQVTTDDVSEEYPVPAPAASLFPSIIHGRSIMVIVAFGEYPSDASIATLNDVLSTLQVAANR
jgi:hypothetical protein